MYDKLDLSIYDLSWRDQSKSSADSMPLGGYDMGCNVWVENNSLFLYVSESGTFDENNTMLKLCRLRLSVEPMALLSENFCQTLHLEQGYISVTAGSGENAIAFDLWASTDKPELHVDFKSKTPRKLRLSLDSWRYCDRPVPEEERGQCRDYAGYPGEVITRADTLLPQKQELLFFHRNRNENSLWELLLKQQHAWELRDTVPNPLLNRTMGGLLRTGALQYEGAFEGKYAGVTHMEHRYAAAARTEEHITLTLHTAQCETLEDWEQQLRKKAAIPASREVSAAWWGEYFRQSYVIIDPDHPGSTYFHYGRNYQLFRYMLGCNIHGEYPTKFNGGLFTFDEGRTPDYRMWSGGGFTGQNQRLVYWPMLKTGDFAAMLPQLDYYRNLTGAMRARIKHFFGHGGAFYFEQGNLFGLSIGMEYSWDHSPENSFCDGDNPWVRLHYSTGLEIALMCLEYHRYSGQDISDYLDFIESTVEFYFAHYPIEDGKLCVFPSTALETYKGADPRSKNDLEYGCKNPMDVVAGLHCLTEALSRYYVGNEEKCSYYKKLNTLCPPLPTGENKQKEGMFLPAEVYNPVVFNCELPQLYRVFPFSCFGLSPQEKELGRAAYLAPYPSEDQYMGVSWHQNGIFAARLNLLEEAEKYLDIKLGDGPRRFPAFWGPGHDWSPDHNHGGSGMIGLQEMLLQCGGGDLEFLPTWNKEIDVSFKLFAPGGKTVRCVYSGGKILEKEITETERN